MKTRNIVFILIAVTALLVGLDFVSKSTNKVSEVQSIDLLLDWKMGSFYAPYLLASDEGYYSANGLNVTFTEGQGAETTAKLVGQGKYKLGTSNAAATAIAVDNGVPVVSVAMIEQDAVTAIFSLKRSDITEAKDLIGKTLGVRYYDISHKEYLAMMRAKGLDPTKVKEVSIGWELQPLLTGQVDALYNYAYNMPVVLEQQGQEVNKILVKDNGVRGYGSNIIANRGFAMDHSEVLKKFLDASRKGWRDALINPDKAIAALKKRYPETDTRVALATLKAQLTWLGASQESEKFFYQTTERWRDVLETYRSFEMIKNNLQPADVYSNQYLK